jgi:hypothetical protein
MPLKACNLLPFDERTSCNWQCLIFDLFISLWSNVSRLQIPWFLGPWDDLTFFNCCCVGFFNLLVKCSVTWAMPPALFCFSFVCLERALDHGPPTSASHKTGISGMCHHPHLGFLRIGFWEFHWAASLELWRSHLHLLWSWGYKHVPSCSAFLRQSMPYHFCQKLTSKGVCVLECRGK